MKVILVMVTSLNGKITNDTQSDIYHWTSPEDAKLFFSLIAKCRLMVMGSKTYEAARDKITLNKHTLRIVYTKHPEKYTKDVVTGQLEFTKETPQALVKRLGKLGYKEMLLVGGGQINSLFFKEKLVSELWLTIEPKLFGTGKNLIADIPLNVNLRLIDVRKLNETGTLHCTYIIM